jgi:REP element-mobilizing transposase RayT
MPRPPRIHYPGAVYHVMARGVDGREVFADDLDRQTFLTAALRSKTETSCSFLAYFLMGNHFHFALRVGNIPLSQVMHRLLTVYVMAFNLRHERHGHLFQARFKSVLCLDDSYLISLVRYIHMNPVRAGLVAKPDHWPWSSHGQYVERTANPIADPRLFFDALNASGAGGGDYNAWLKGPDNGFKAWPDAAASSPLFREEFADAKSIDALAFDLFPDDILELRSASRRRAISEKRFIVAAKAVKTGHSQMSIAEWMGRTPQAIHNLLHRNK